MPLSPANLHKATRTNRVFAHRIGWLSRFNQIIGVFGFTSMTPDETSFAQAVAKWQANHPPLAADGMLGPKTWRQLEPFTRFTPGPATIPPAWIRQPPAPHEEQEADLSTDIWMGLAVDYGGHFFAIGKHNMHAALYSIDHFHKNFILTGESWRIGPGLGGGIGLAFILITSLSDPRHMNSAVGSGWDLQIAIGERWGALIHHIKHLEGYERIAEIVKKSERGEKVAEHLLKHAVKLKPGEWWSLRGRAKELVSSLSLKTDALTPQVFTMSIPLPYLDAFMALEVSGYWQFTNYRTEVVNAPRAHRGL